MRSSKKEKKRDEQDRITIKKTRQGASARHEIDAYRMTEFAIGGARFYRGLP